MVNKIIDRGSTNMEKGFEVGSQVFTESGYDVRKMFLFR